MPRLVNSVRHKFIYLSINFLLRVMRVRVGCIRSGAEALYGKEIALENNK